MQDLAAGAKRHGQEFIVIGDSKSPREFALGGADFYSLDHQRSLPLSFARLCPERHYARKNIGYLLAWQNGADVIRETDDDNFPRDGFWQDSDRQFSGSVVESAGWVNAYRYFTDGNIWPRGLPLDEIASAPTPAPANADCPIQQGLADENPDVDAIFRLVLTLPFSFENRASVALGRGAWCPFNSQNTTWFRDAAVLMYLPSYCSFRMTDIWRSFVTQRIAWENGWSILFHGATVYQDRNEHNLMRDFADEVSGYLNNKAIATELDKLKLRGGPAHIGEDLRTCYQALIKMGLIDSAELALIDAWLADLASSSLTAAGS